MGFFGYQPEEEDDGIPSAELLDIVRRSLSKPSDPIGRNIGGASSSPWFDFPQPAFPASTSVERDATDGGSGAETDHGEIQSTEPGEVAPFKIATMSPEGVSSVDQWRQPAHAGGNPASPNSTAGANLRGFPPEIIAGAQATQQKTGIPASVTLAQWALESGWGKMMPPGSNNPFGIKAVGGQPFVTTRTREENSRGESYYTDAKFRKFESLQQALDAHAQVLMSDRFASARAALPDVDGFLDKLTGVYGKGKKYGTILRKIVHGRNLDILDKSKK